MMSISTDASIFEIEPKEVIYPANRKDLVEIVQDLLNKGQHFTMRAGGTSIGGQAIGDGVLIDISKYLTSIVSFSKKDREVTVEPGVIQDDLNDYLKPYNLKFAPDTSTSNRAMIGGMIGNNSCGAYSVYYGTTREHVKSIEVLLSDGSLVVFKELDELELKQKLQLQSLEGDIYRFVVNTLNHNKAGILNAFPDESLIRRNTGYAIDELIRKHQPFNSVGNKFNLTPLICGSEGTLGVIIKATLNLVELPKYKSLIVAQFESEEQALMIVHNLMQFKPAAVEFIDKPTLEVSKNNAQQNSNRTWIKGNPDAVLVIEFFSNSKKAQELTVIKCQQWLKSKKAYDYSEIDPKDYKKVWGIRKAGLGLLMGRAGSRKALAVIEDAAIPLKYLHQYYKEVKEVIKLYNITAVYYGHASVGLIHIRPELDLSIEKDKEIMSSIAYDVSILVKKYKGSLSGEHGDGRIRAPYIKDQLGQEVYQLLVDLKYTFDPKNLLNPNVIIGNNSITKDLRSVAQPNVNITAGFDWSDDISFFSATEKCNGAGVCRQSAGRGIMCPSYKATRDENFSTRGRANLLRKALSSNNPLKELSNAELKEALDLCLGCKACKTECPASVDMAKLKSEYLYQTQKQQDQLELWRIKNLGRILKFGSKVPELFNLIQNSTIAKKVAKLEGDLPQMQSTTLSKWWKHNKPTYNEYEVTVWVLCDIYTEYYDTQVGKDLLSFLKSCKVNIELINLDTSIIALISKGLLNEAKQALNRYYAKLSNISEQDLIVGIDPSEALVWRDDAKYLVEKTLQVNLFEEVVIMLNKSNLLPKLKSIDEKVYVHLHCHQKSLVGKQITIDALSLIPKLQVEFLNTGCCGMAGDFGYKNQKLANAIKNQSFNIKYIESLGGNIIVRTGFSCAEVIKKTKSKEVISLFSLYGDDTTNFSN
jgi:FAD/FMN-containing dehydrogenase/Fe-S oxidoreductase